MLTKSYVQRTQAIFCGTVSVRFPMRRMIVEMASEHQEIVTIPSDESPGQQRSFVHKAATQKGPPVCINQTTTAWVTPIRRFVNADDLLP